VSGDLSVIDAEYWQDTEQGFYPLLEGMHRNLMTGQPLTDLNRQWLAFLTRESALLFDRYAQPGRIGRADPARVFRAWQDLERFTSPHSKKIRALLELPDTPGRDERPGGAGDIVRDRTTDPEPGRIFSRPEVQDALLSWWKDLHRAGGDLKVLRHCRTPAEVACTPAFHRLRHQLEPLVPFSSEHGIHLALVAGVLSHVNGNLSDEYERDVRRSFAAQMARPPMNRGPGKKARVSSLRFRHLLGIDDPDRLYPALIRIVRRLNGSVDITSLAEGIYPWDDHTKREWACAYYAYAPREDEHGG
jgi:CRISPR system Cascade subunit CasB